MSWTARADLGPLVASAAPSRSSRAAPTSTIVAARLACAARAAAPTSAIAACCHSASDPTGNNRTNGFTGDDVVMFANYVTASEYEVLFDPATPGTIQIQQGFYAFQRDFTTWWTAPVIYDQAAVDDAFLDDEANAK